MEMFPWCVYVSICFTESTGDCGGLGCIYYNSNPLGWEPQGIGRMLTFLTIQV